MDTLGAQPGDTSRIAAAFREDREAQGLSIRALARKADVSYSYLAKFENGDPDVVPTVRWLRDVARALGRNLAEMEQAS